MFTVINDFYFDENDEARLVALDISKAIENVWDAGLLHQLKGYGVPDQIFNLIQMFLTNRRMNRVNKKRPNQPILFFPMISGLLALITLSGWTYMSMNIVVSLISVTADGSYNICLQHLSSNVVVFDF